MRSTPKLLSMAVATLLFAACDKGPSTDAASTAKTATTAAKPTATEQAKGEPTACDVSCNRMMICNMGGDMSAMQEARRKCAENCQKPGMEDKAKKCNVPPWDKDKCSEYMSCMGY
jgi:hypothetical protein